MRHAHQTALLLRQFSYNTRPCLFRVSRVACMACPLMAQEEQHSTPDGEHLSALVPCSEPNAYLAFLSNAS